MKTLRVVMPVALLILSSAGMAFGQSVPEVEQVVMSVRDLARSEEMYTSVLGFKEIGRGDGVSGELQRLWNLPPEVTMKWVYLEKPDATDGIHIRLVQFSPERPRIRYANRWQDPGLNDIHLCGDTRAAYKTLMEKGFTAYHEPVIWAGGGGELGYGGRQWYEAFMQGFDGEGVTLMDNGLPTAKLQFAATQCTDPTVSAFSPIRDVTITINKKADGYRFMHNLIGWRDVGEWEAFGSQMEMMLNAPHGVVARPIFFRIPGREKTAPGIIMVETAGVTNLDLSARSAPPYRGFAVLTFKTDQFEDLYARFLEDKSFPIVMSPVKISDQPYSGSRAFSVRGPDGIFVEFIDRKPK